jgi:hypothetical protein
MLPYIERERSSYEAGETIYANTLWLYERVNSSTQFGVAEYGSPKLFFRPVDEAA